MACVSWLDLQGHASFPSTATAIGNETVELPVGVEECLRYIVTDDETMTTCGSHERGRVCRSRSPSLVVVSC